MHLSCSQGWEEEPLPDLSPLRLPHLARQRVPGVCASLLALSFTEPQAWRRWRRTTSVHDVQVVVKLPWQQTLETSVVFVVNELTFRKQVELLNVSSKIR